MCGMSVKAAALEVTGRRYSGEMTDVPLKDAEHYLFARSSVEDKRLWIPVLAVGIPLWDLMKVPGYELGWSDTPANWKEINAGYKGIFDALTGGGIK